MTAMKRILIPHASMAVAAALLISALPCAAQGDSESSPVVTAEQISPKMEDGTRDLLSHCQNVLRILKDITTTQKADDEADELTAEFNALADAEDVLNDLAKHTPPEVMTETVERLSKEINAYKDWQREVPEQLQRLLDANCFNSEKLTAAINPLCGVFFDCVELPPEPEPKSATAEQISQLIEMQAADRKKLLDRWPTMVQGGPGFTRDSAWVILNDSDLAVRMEYDILREDLHYPAPSAQALIMEGGRVYDKHILTIPLGHERVVVEQWFDITRYWQKSTSQSGSAEPES